MWKIMDEKKYEVFCSIMNEMDRAYDLMKEYDSLPHHYGDYVLYQAESHMIEHIGMNEGVTITKLAEELGKTRSACCQMVRKLRNKKWVEQIRNERNNREYNLYLTGGGKRIFKNHAEFDFRCYKRNFEGLAQFGYEDLEKYLEIQKKINKSFQKDVEESEKYFKG